MEQKSKRLKVKDYGMKMHMSLASGAVYVYFGNIDVPEHPMHNRVIRNQAFVAKKKKEESVSEWSIDGQPDKEVFTTLKELMDFYKLPTYNDGTQEQQEKATDSGEAASPLP